MNIGTWIIINLDKRPEKEETTRTQLINAGVTQTKIVRLSATAEKQGHLGCSISHVRALQWAFVQPHEWIAVVEDDFQWRDPEIALSEIDAIMKANEVNDMFDVLMGDVRHVLPPIQMTVHPELKLSYVQRGTLSGMYAIRRSFIPALLNVLARGVCAMKLGGSPSQFTIDQVWKDIQHQSQRFCCTEPLLGRQVSTWSDTDHVPVVN